MTGGLPGSDHEIRSTDVRSDGVRCGRRVVVGGVVIPFSRAKYCPVSRDDSTVPSVEKPIVTSPPSKGLIGSAVPLMIITAIGLSVGVQARFSAVGRLAEIDATPANCAGRSIARR